MIQSLLRTAKHKLGLDHIRFNDLYLPILRTNQGLKDNQEYLDSGKEQVQFLKDSNLLSGNTSMLDFGCGQGRLANCIHSLQLYPANYIGVDTDNYSINWCKKYIGSYEQGFKFVHVPAFNARYNQNAQGLKPLPLENGSFDLIFLNSVFSHMLEDDVRFYLNDFNRLLKSNGKVYLTAFIEENVPDVSENPDDYLEQSTGALHRVRFEKNHIYEMFSQAGFQVDQFLHQGIERTKQSVVVLQKLV